MKGDIMFAPLFSVWQIDAWADGESGWTWNDKFRLFEFRTNASDIRRVFVRRLREFLANGVNVFGYCQHVDLGKGWYYVTDDWHCIELKKRCNGEPVYACIRETPL